MSEARLFGFLAVGGGMAVVAISWSAPNAGKNPVFERI